MKKRIILLPLIGLLIYTVLSSNNSGPATVSFLNGTGSSGVSGCSCHSGSSTSTTTVSIQLLSGSTPVSSYTPGGSYTIRITGTQTSGSLTLPYYGYQVSAVKSSGAGSGSAVQAGTLSAPSGSHVTSISGLSVVEHSSRITGSTGTSGGGAGTTYVQDIPWTAPIAGTGDVKIYGVVNAVNGDGGATTADKWNNTNITVCESPTSISGTASMCVSGTTTLTCSTPGGTWSSSATGTATVSGSGTTATVTGVAPGTANILYTNGCGGASSITVTVLTTPSAITSSSSFTVCQGANISLNATPAGGTWASTGGGFAAISSTSGLVSGVSGGVSAITYTLSTGCFSASSVTVNSLPSAGTINPTPATACIGTPVTLTNSVSTGSWSVSSLSGGFATIGSSTGVITGTVAGTVTVSYTVTTAGCTNFTTRVMTVNPTPGANSGTAEVCVGASTTLSNSTAGGTWTTTAGTGSVTLASAGSAVAVTGATSGTANVSYIVGGCPAVTVVTVNALPSAGTISGGPNVCLGGTASLTDGVAGGVWSSSASGTAGITGSGTTATVSGAALGTATISYSVTNGAGCTSVATKVVTVQPNPGSITGTASACVGASSTLSSSPAGGTWSSSSGNVTVSGTSGSVNGVSAGTAPVTYTLATGCSSITTFTVNALPTVALISGTVNPCVASSVVYTDATAGGTWTTTGGTGSVSLAASGTSVAVTGIAAGTAFLTYTVTNGSGCTAFTTKTLTVNTSPSSITGTASLCVGATTVLTGSGGSGSWASSSSTTAGVTSPGVTSTVSGNSAGIATITFTLSSTGCSITKDVTVNPVPASITGSSSVCSGATTTLTSATTGGTWTSSNTAQATVGSSSGDVTGLGTTTSVPTITYTLSTGCRTTKSITVNTNPNPISGASGVCVGSSVTLSSSTPGGIWSSSSISTATVGSTSAVTTGIASGTATITYTLPLSGCFATKPVTVIAAPSDFSGTPVCFGSTLTLSSTPSGGTWASSNTTIAPVGSSSGVVTGAGVGVANITYSVGGCSLVKPQTVTASPAIISGSSNVCEGASITLSDLTAGGTWSTVAGTGSVSLAGSGTTISVTGVTVGTATISYTSGSGCSVEKIITVNTAPAAIGGVAPVCAGQTITLTNSVSGGTWTSANTARATVGSATGVVTGVSAGTVNISYSLSGGCFAVASVTVNALSAISGLSSLCASSSTTLTNATVGGTWASSVTSVATIGSASGALSALTPGTTDITYTLPTGCTATKSVTVISAPSPISGSLRVCIGTPTTLSSPGGGTWSSSNTSVATVGSSTGVVSGVASGVSTITYSLGTSCVVTAVVTVSANPAAIGGSTSMCEGVCITLTDATGGGSWSTASSDATVGSSTGAVCGVTAGTPVISYTLPTGCYAVKTVTVKPVPSVITGVLAICQAGTTTLSSTPSGGSWLSGTTTVATVVSTSGIVTGVASGTSNITYTASGCSRTTQVTVNAIPSVISGAGTVCIGSVTSYSTTPTGGTWSIAPTTTATVNPVSGDVAGLSSGVAILTYTSASGCVRTKVVTVNPLPSVAAITGTLTVCESGTTTLANTTAGGVWSGGSVSTASISSSGVVSGVTAGTATVTYSVTSGGCSAFSMAVVTVNVSPAPITGTLSICAGAGTTLSDATAGGTWSSGSVSIAAIGSSSGAVSGLLAGTSVISYTISNGCSARATLTVNAIPSTGTVSGSSTVCVGASSTLTSTVGGGVWTITGTTGTASIGSSSGVVTGSTTGVVNVTYTVSSSAGCTDFATRSMTVNPLPVAGTISGPTSVCAGSSITLTNATVGGVWSSSNATATVGSTGIVTGVTAGVDTIRYSVTNSCGTAVATYSITINPLPVAGTISGTGSICAGAATTLSSSVTGGTWSSGAAGIATVSTTGVVTGVASGTAMISYSVTNGCGTANATFIVTVNPLPVAGTITGTDSVCEGATITMSNSISGGAWSTALGLATINSAGVVTGVTGGIDTVKYTVTNACGSAVAVKIIRIRTYAVCHVGVSPVEGTRDDIKLYPNPSQGTFTVEIPGINSVATITVADVLGKVLVVRSVDIEKTVLEMGNIPTGTYLVTINKDNSSYHYKMVIR